MMKHKSLRRVWSKKDPHYQRLLPPRVATEETRAIESLEADTKTGTEHFTVLEEKNIETKLSLYFYT